MKRIYLDNNSGTQVDPKVVEAMREELSQPPANPSSVHTPGQEAKRRLEKARQSIGEVLNLDPKELIFTSSGTESLNLAILGSQPKGHIITSKIEHASAFETLQSLSNPVTYLPVGKEGHILPSDLKKAIRSDTSLIVLSGANSETGVIASLEEIASIANAHQIPLIVDGVALLGKTEFTIPEGVTAMAFSSSKIHGPKGVGLLYSKKNHPLSPLFHGGVQEKAKRPGTENLPGIIGFAKAIELIDPTAMRKMERLRNKLENALPATINGTGPRICNTTNLLFSSIDGETLLIQLDQMGIAASMGSACSAGALEPSRVLLEMGLTKKEALSSLRFSLSRFTTEEEIDVVINHFNTLFAPQSFSGR